MLTYVTKLVGAKEDLDALRRLLEYERDVFNIASIEQFKQSKRSIVLLHSAVYRRIRDERPEIPAQVVIRGEHDCLARYAAAKTNKHKMLKPHVKKGLSITLDIRLYRVPDRYTIRITTADGRKTYGLTLYPKLKEMLDTMKYRDPSVF